MKLDDDVKMISAEVPILFAKAAELFIQELTIHSWLQTEESRRRTLQVCAEVLRQERWIVDDFSSVTMSLRRSPRMSCTTSSSTLSRAKKPRRRTRRKMQSAKCNTSLRYPTRREWGIPFNCQVCPLFSSLTMFFTSLRLDGQIIQLPQNLSSNIVTMAVSETLVQLIDRLLFCFFFPIEPTRYSTTIYHWTLKQWTSLLRFISLCNDQISSVFSYLLVCMSIDVLRL